MCVHTHGGRHNQNASKQERDETEKISALCFCGRHVRLNQYFHLNNSGVAGRHQTSQSPTCSIYLAVR